MDALKGIYVKKDKSAGGIIIFSGNVNLILGGGYLIQRLLNQ